MSHPTVSVSTSFLSVSKIYLQWQLMAHNARDEPNFVSVFGAENEEFDCFWSVSFSDENVFHCFRIFFRFQPKTHPFPDENVRLDSLQSVCQRPSKRIKWGTSVTFIVTVDG